MKSASKERWFTCPCYPKVPTFGTKRGQTSLPYLRISSDAALSETDSFSAIQSKISFANLPFAPAAQPVRLPGAKQNVSKPGPSMEFHV